MTTHFLNACRHTTASVLAVALVFAGVGCKPSPPASTSQGTPPTDSSSPRQPTAADFQASFQAVLPATMKVSEVKMDPPVRMPNASPASNTWLLSIKLTLTPAEDLLSLPSTEDAKIIDDLVSELNSLVAWRNAYVNSPYAKACGAFEVKAPASPLPQLLVITQPKDHPMPPIYAKMAAEWQVDHWQFAPTQQNTSTALLNAGKLRSEFTGPTMVKGSPEAEKAIGGVRDAVAQARKEIDAIRSRYAAQVAKGTKPGTVYTGTVSFRQNVAPCELRFLDPPPGGDAHFASLEVRLTSENPPCVFAYNAKVTTELPIPVPGPEPTPAGQNPAFDFDTSNQVPGYNLKISLVRSVGKMDERRLPGYILSGNRHDFGTQTLLLLDRHVEGKIAYDSDDIHLSAQLTHP